MKQNYPKFDKKITEMINSSQIQRERPRYGILVSYDRSKNTAKIMLEDRYSDSISDVLTNVPCPFTAGVQTVSPEPGARCIVGFRNATETNPYVISFYVTQADMSGLTRNDYAATQVPRYLI